MRGGIKLGFAGLVMAGGRGLRLKADVEKPLLPICGSSMFERVVNALRGSKYIASIFAAVTRWTPKTKCKAQELGVTIIETSGLGYIEDLREALKILWSNYGCRNVIVVNSDLPLLRSEVIDEAIQFYLKSGAETLTLVVKKDDYVKLGFKADYPFDHQGVVVVPIGLNVIRADLVKGNELLKEVVYIYPKTELLVNVNTIEEARRAEELLKSYGACHAF